MNFRTLRAFPLFFLLSFSVLTSCIDSKPVAISGHSHNDYVHDRPLWDALDNKFISIEADIRLVGQALLVGHDKEDLNESLTLQSLYLDPLQEYIKSHNGWVYPNRELILLVDIKTSADSTYRILRSELAKYADMLTTYTQESTTKRAVSVVISGNRPRELMLSEPTRYAAFDGRIPDLDSEINPNFITLVSDNWANHFMWRGLGPMAPEEHEKLAKLIERAHSANCKIRFWNLPAETDSQHDAVWAELLKAGVDLINVDDLEAFREYIEN